MSMDEESLIWQREKLKQQLQTQRKLIEEEILPALIGEDEENTYPRSKIMRFLTKRPGFISGFAKEVLILFAGVRLFKLLTALLLVIKLLNPMDKGQKLLPSPPKSNHD